VRHAFRYGDNSFVMANIEMPYGEYRASYGDNLNSYGEYRTPYGDNLAYYGEYPLAVWRKLFCYGGYGVRGRRRYGGSHLP
jgi:hypothetical protein